MLKIRVIPTLLMRDVNLVKGPSFDSWRAVGSPMQSVKVFNRRDVDELILLDIGATPGGRDPDYDMVEALAQECFVPLTVGGGVRSIEVIRKLLLLGADKVSINTAAYEISGLVTEAARQFGSQCVVVSIDYRRTADGMTSCFSHCGTVDKKRSPISWAVELERLGAGEILLTSIERDGTMEGYDLEMIAAVADAISIPVIASGGAGNYDQMCDAVLKAHASAVSAASIYLFTQATPLEAKAAMADAGIPVRASLKN